jgi:hypothetical protein
MARIVTELKVVGEERNQKNDWDWNAYKIEQNGPHKKSFLHKLHVITLPPSDGRSVACTKRSDQKGEKYP